MEMANDYLTERQELDILEHELLYERSTFETYWKDLARYFLPRRERFSLSDANRGERKNTDIIDSAGTFAARTLSSGIMSGVTSPARQWFKLISDNAELNESPEVKSYFAEVERRMRAALLKSNLYNQLPVLYGDFGVFATGAIFQEEDFDYVSNFLVFPIGSYAVACDRRGRVNTFFRQFRMSVRQVIDRFARDPNDPTKIDWSVLSQAVKDHYERNQMETLIDINHFILPNKEFNPSRPESKFKRFKSVYYERGFSDTQSGTDVSQSFPDRFLSKKGYDYFPVYVLRWETVGEDTYGTNSPGMISLGDTKQLQLQEMRIAEALDQKIRPSMVGPTSLRNNKASMIPGDITYLDEAQGNKAFRRLFEVNFDIRETEAKQVQLRQAISKAFYEDLFLMLANSDRRQITATEVAERQQEKLLGLGPVLERINQDLLDPLIENTFMIMERQGLLPDLPEKLEGVEYQIEYVSVMAQAQKLAGIGNIERLVNFVGGLAGIVPEAVMKLDIEEIIEKYADKSGVDPELIISKEQMEAIKEEAAAAQAEQMAQQRAMEDAQISKTLSETKMDENTALNEIMSGEVQ